MANAIIITPPDGDLLDIMLITLSSGLIVTNVRAGNVTLVLPTEVEKVLTNGHFDLAVKLLEQENYKVELVSYLTDGETTKIVTDYKTPD